MDDDWKPGTRTIPNHLKLKAIYCNETNSSHQKIGFLKKKFIFQPLIFRAYVSFREGTSNLSELLAIGHLTSWHDHPRGETRDAKPLCLTVANELF